MEAPTTAKANGTATPDKGFGLTPEALSGRRKAIPVSDGGLIVAEKWSAQKLILILGYASNAVSGLSAPSLKGLDSKTTALTFIQVLGDKVLGLVELSVRPEDRDKIKDLDADELVDVLDAVIELNLTEKFTKKIQSLMERFKPLSTARPQVTPSK
jgi:hypothetical protein